MALHGEIARYAGSFDAGAVWNVALPTPQSAPHLRSSRTIFRIHPIRDSNPSAAFFTA